MIDEELFYPDTPLTEFLDSNTKSYERVIGTDNIFFVYSSTERMYGLNSPISHDLHQQLEIGIINLIGEDIWDSQTNPQIKANKANFLSPVIDLFGIKYLVVPSSLDIESVVSEELDNSYDLVYEWNDVKVYQNLTYEGIAFVIGSIRHYHTDDELLELLSDPELDVYDIAFSNDTELSQKYDQVEPLSSTEIVKYDFDEVVYKVTSSSPGVLVMSELYWPGWKAFINGEEGEIIKINGIFRAVEVPEGVSEVVLMYEGVGILLGYQSLSSVLLLLGCF
ncbi:YfhO family protein [Candidatus Nomurabacteria bacterium]|nr:YfhO family protein [Candidatus Nomurabacteria bacterium]